MGINAHFLSRGYGGREIGPHRVDPATDTASDVGDEPLLLAHTATTWVSRDRGMGLKPPVMPGPMRLSWMTDCKTRP